MLRLLLKFAAAQVEAEIYKYRLSVGTYENVKVESKWWKLARTGQLKSAALQSAMRTMKENHKGEARTTFGLRLKKIEAELMDGAMSKSNITPQNLKGEPPEKLGLKMAYPIRKPMLDYDSESDTEQDDPTEMPSTFEVEEDPNMSKAQKLKMKTTAKLPSVSGGNNREADDVEATKSFTAGKSGVEDNGTGPMDVQVYVQCRLLVKLLALRKEMPKKNRAYKIWQVLAYFFTVLGTFLASYDNAHWVPAAAAVAAAIKAVNEYQSLEQGRIHCLLVVGCSAWHATHCSDVLCTHACTRACTHACPRADIPITNNAIQQLSWMDTWWRSLSMVQKQDPAFKNIVVEVTEDAILNAVGSWVAMMKTPDGALDEKDGDKDDDDDEHGDEKKGDAK